MDKYQKNRAYKIDKQCPGCLGRMVNLFDVCSCVSANKLITDKPHLQGSPSRNRSGGARMCLPSGTKKRNNKLATPDLRNIYYLKPHPASMEMLSLDETSREAESKHGSPNVMGFTALPRQQQDYTIERNETKKEMDIVHPKFVECQSKSEKLCEFKDAVEVLSSNKEILLKFLPKDKPNPPYLSYDGDESENQPTQIVVLKPSLNGTTTSSVSLPCAASTNVFEVENGNVLENGSFSRSEFEYAAENFIDYRFDSPSSLSSLSRGTYSPETSLCRKKRLSERRVMMATDGTSREEERHTCDKSYYTLGEMFALSESNDAERFHLNQTGHNASIVNDTGKKTESFSFMGKVSSLLFSRNKRPIEKKSQSMESSPGLLTKSSPDSTMLTSLNQEVSIPMPVMCRNAMNQDQDQPSPVSVLELFCEEDAMQTPESSEKQLLSHISIGKSPLIESVARTLTRDGSWSEKASCSEYHVNAEEENEQEWVRFFHGAKRERRKSESDSYCSSSSMAVERMVRKEVVLGDYWNQEVRLEIHTMGEEIEGELVEELVDQTVSDLLLVSVTDAA